MKLRKGTTGYLHWCPGCDEYHFFRTVREEGKPCWTFNGNMEKPSFGPSMLIRWDDPDGELPKEVCHYFITNGQIQFCGDTTHSLSGKIVDLPDVPDRG